jgi:hypothetical protein
MPFSGYIDDVDPVTLNPQLQLLKSAQSFTVTNTITSVDFFGAYNNNGATTAIIFTLEAPSDVSYGKHATFTATEAEEITIGGSITYNGVQYAACEISGQFDSVVLYSDGSTYHVLNTAGSPEFLYPVP